MSHFLRRRRQFEHANLFWLSRGLPLEKSSEDPAFVLVKTSRCSGPIYTVLKSSNLPGFPTPFSTLSAFKTVQCSFFFKCDLLHEIFDDNKQSLKAKTQSRGYAAANVGAPPNKRASILDKPKLLTTTRHVLLFRRGLRVLVRFSWR